MDEQQRQTKYAVSQNKQQACELLRTRIKGSKMLQKAALQTCGIVKKQTASCLFEGRHLK